ncbi:hypothetical protein T05_9811 [Trichinella murrelli]|uniref:Uncharacterized protein n=1 Tax=Trichinella murrelli TaxID=144512 RepID=A0A0V0TJW5_9BILA|nr:hypothetical protein T05_9811 [Trichinella murrelli]
MAPRSQIAARFRFVQEIPVHAGPQFDQVVGKEATGTETTSRTVDEIPAHAGLVQGEIWFLEGVEFISIYHSQMTLKESCMELID